MNTHHYRPESSSGAGCDAVAPLLPLVAQRLLEPDEAQAVRAHLSGCGSCRTRLAAYDRLDDALRQHFEQLASPPIRMEELMSRVQYEEQYDRIEEPAAAPVSPAPSAPPRAARRGPRRVFSWVAAIAAVLIIALITTALFASHHSPGQTARPRASATATPAPPGPSGVYFATTSFPPSATPGTLYALKAQDGSVHWQEQAPAPLEGWPVLSNGTLYMLTVDYQNNVSDGDAVYAVKLSDGTILWHTSIETHAQILQVVDGVVYTGTSGGVIFALSAGDGSILWQRQLSTSEADVLQISNGLVYVSVIEGGPHTVSGSLYALNAADGSVRWHDELHGMPTINVVGGQVDAVAVYEQDGPNLTTVYLTPTFYALDADTGAQRWSYGGVVSTSMHLAGADANAVYLTTSQIGSSLTTLLALDAGDGSVRWQKSVTGQDLSASVAPDNTMYLAFLGGVSAVNLLDGSEIWNNALSGPCFLRLFVDGTLYVTAGSTLFALDSSNGLVKWRYQAPNPGVHAVVNGVLYGSSVQVDTQRQSMQSSVFALDTSSGKQLWKYDTASAITVPVVG